MAQVVDEDVAATFLRLLQEEAAKFNGLVSTDNGEWIVKGFIDVYRNLYAISADTKVVSKLIELMLFPYFAAFALTNHMRLIPSREQNHYPDLTFVDQAGHKFAVDLKSTYRTGPEAVNTMTLGAFTGYFRNRQSSKNITFPYAQYAGHFVLGVVYTRATVRPDELARYNLQELDRIPSVAQDFRFFAQPKYRIAKDQPGSGNTKNIGAVNNLGDLVSGNGPFAALGEAIFDDYWMYYLTADMARAVELERPPYHNLQSFAEYKRGPHGSTS